MKHSETIRLTDELIDAVKKDSEEVHQLVINELSNSKGIISILTEYDYLNESKGEVHDFSIIPDSIELRGNGEGSFKVSYVVEFFYACDAITTKHPQEMMITFKINFEASQATFSGVDIPEREPDEF